MLVTITTKDKQHIQRANFIELTPNTVEIVRYLSNGSTEITKMKQENMVRVAIEQVEAGE